MMTSLSVVTTQLYELYDTFIYKNDIFIATLTLFLFALIGTAVYKVVWRMFDMLNIGFVTTVSFTNSNTEQELHKKFLLWIADNSKSIVSNSAFQMSSTQLKINDMDEDDRPRDATLDLLPGVGSQVFWYKGYLMWMSRVASTNPVAIGSSEQMFLFETVYISTYGDNRSIFEELFREIQGVRVKLDISSLNIYGLNEFEYWSQIKRAPLREMSSVFLQNNIGDRILKDVIKYLSTREYYSSKGVPYRRGYLLYGPPGCGKTSFIASLASRLSLSIYYLSLSKSGFTDSSLQSVLLNVPPKCILLLEDIDSVFQLRSSTSGVGITFSGLLNAIDGVGSQDGRILFMTTNHIEKIDPALLRPGRADVKVYFDLANKQQTADMFKAFYEDSPKSQKSLKQIVGNIPEMTVSTAVLQGHFINHSNSCVEAAKNWQSIIQSQEQITNEFSMERIDKVNPPQSVQKRFFESGLIKDWLNSTKSQCMLSKEVKAKILEGLEKEDITTLGELIELEDSEIEEMFDWAKKVEICRFTRAVAGLKKLKESDSKKDE